MRSLALAGLGLLGAAALAAQDARRFEFAEERMGTIFRVVLYAFDESAARQGAAASFSLVARLDSLFSDYRTDSEIARLGSASPTEPVSVSTELWTILRIAQEWSVRTGGAFDVTVGPLSKLWRWAARRGEIPDAARIAAARAAVGFRRLEVDPARPVVRFLEPGMALDLGAIAKGFAADAVVAELARRGIRSVLVDAGGDLALGDSPPGEPGWRIGLPEGGSVVVARVGVATSGATYRYREVAGVRYSHVIDPATDLGVRDAPFVTVIAADATSADVLASTLTVLDPEAGRALLRSVEGTAAKVSGPFGYRTANFPGRRGTHLHRANR